MRPALAARLPYGKRLATSADTGGARVSPVSRSRCARSARSRDAPCDRGDRVCASANPDSRTPCPTSAFRTPSLGGCAAVRTVASLRCRDGSGERIASWWHRGRPQGLRRRDRALRECASVPGCQLPRRASACTRAAVVSGAAACVMTSLAVPELGAHALSPAELFAP